MLSPFTYRVPLGMEIPEPGVRVLVPFGPRRMIGVVTAQGGEYDTDMLKDVSDLIDETPLAPRPLFDLANWLADYYLAPPGECLKLVFPPAGVRASQAIVRLAQPGLAPPDPLLDALRDGPLKMSTLSRRLGRDPSARLARLRRDGLVTVEQDLTARGFRTRQVAILAQGDFEPKGKAQAAILAELRTRGERLPVADLTRERPSWRSALAALARHGAVRLETERWEREIDSLPGGAASRPTLTDAQRAIAASFEAAVSAGAFSPHLLYGVTGSGKTELYFAAAERALALGRGVLMLVPEIALTPLLVRAALARFGAIVAVLHSDLAQGERHDQWWRIREGQARVVIGARSAVFAPIPELGLIVVDEEHEDAYKQEESPRYHARDVAVMRAKLEGCPVVLGSATPALESYTNALKGKYTLAMLPTRIGSQGLATTVIVNRRELVRTGQDTLLTPPLIDALTERLARREQALLLLNRRGYAVSLLCRECGAQALCPNCSVSLTIHHAGSSLLCHYCGHEARAHKACAGCGGEYLRLAGYGTEKVVEAVQAALPQARVDRLDRDRAQRKGVVAQVLAAFEAGEIDILIGTQMIAKGHDFPRVTLVGVVDADVGLGLPDFRAAERTFGLLTQVSGRAGRADLPGQVILQSLLPDHYALSLACEQDYPAFYEREMEFRRTMAYPPATALLNLILRSADARTGRQRAVDLAGRLHAAANGQYRILGPASAPLARLKGEYRYQIVLKGQRNAMRRRVREALSAQHGTLRWPDIAVDVDPVSLM